MCLLLVSSFYTEDDFLLFKPMIKKLFQIVSLVFLGVFIVLCSAYLFFWLRDFESMKVMFLDVGQGDAILISQGSNQVLIDGGRSGKVVIDQLGRHMPFWDTTIELVVATHPDEDHIGGLVDVVRTYDVGAFVDTRMQSDTLAYQTLQQEKKNHDIVDVEAFYGMKIMLPDTSVLEVEYPNISYVDYQSKDTNSTSIAIKLTTKSNETFLFAGDLPSDEEYQLHVGHIDVLKASHHGSKYSSSNEFLDRITPEDIILSVGKDNRYGHPAAEVMQRFNDHHVRIFRTDMQGSIVYQCEEKCEVAIEK